MHTIDGGCSDFKYVGAELEVNTCPKGSRTICQDQLTRANLLQDNSPWDKSYINIEEMVEQNN